MRIYSDSLTLQNQRIVSPENLFMSLTFGKWLKAMRTEQGLTMQDLADKVDVTHAHISKIESGKAEPHKDTVVRLADALQVDRRVALLAFISEEIDPDAKVTSIGINASTGERIEVTLAEADAKEMTPASNEDLRLSMESALVGWRERWRRINDRLIGDTN